MVFIHLNHFRFGITLAAYTKVPIKKNQEFFASYGHNMVTGPKWYRQLYKQFSKENPSKANEGTLKMIEEYERQLAEGDIKTW